MFEWNNFPDPIDLWVPDYPKTICRLTAERDYDATNPHRDHDNDDTFSFFGQYKWLGDNEDPALNSETWAENIIDLDTDFERAFEIISKNQLPGWTTITIYDHDDPEQNFEAIVSTSTSYGGVEKVSFGTEPLMRQVRDTCSDTDYFKDYELFALLLHGYRGLQMVCDTIYPDTGTLNKLSSSRYPEVERLATMKMDLLIDTHNETCRPARYINSDYIDHPAVKDALRAMADYDIDNFIRLQNLLGLFITPVYLYDHSAKSLSLTRVDEWDTSCIGFATIQKETFHTTEEECKKYIQASLDEMNMWLADNVWHLRLVNALEPTDDCDYIIDEVYNVYMPNNDPVDAATDYFGLLDAVAVDDIDFADPIKCATTIAKLAAPDDVAITAWSIICMNNLLWNRWVKDVANRDEYVSEFLSDWLKNDIEEQLE